MDTTKTERISLRVTPETKRKLQELAESECRTVTNYVEALIDREIRKRK